jgi:2-phosphosulfolactate phosphatase
MRCTVEVLFTPAEFRALRNRDVSRSVCVVFDVLRATSTFVTALAKGAEAIIPVGEISEALAMRATRPGVLLAGERDGVRIGAKLTSGVEFDLGNSPHEYTPEKVRGKTIVSTTTNGTRALRACGGAGGVFIGCFLNLEAVAKAVLERTPHHVLLVCAGTGEGMALEDVLAAGAVCERFVSGSGEFQLLDSAAVAWHAWLNARHDLAAIASRSQNALHLLAHPELSADVAFCLTLNHFDVVAKLNQSGQLVRLR